MKKKYEKPATSVVMLKYKPNLLVSSPVDKVDNEFIDDEYYEDWDYDGGQ